jgi:hypothetical protein
MEDILDVYKMAYNADYPVVCMDESNKQNEESKLKNIRAKPGQVERFDTGYERNGTSNIFLSFEPLSGKRYITVTERRTRLDWAKYIQELIEKHYIAAKKVILVMDNLNIHTGAALYELLEPEHAKKILDKIEFHYTPKHGSWLNIAEIELSHLFRQCLNRRLANIDEVRSEATTWMDDRNKNNVCVNWQFTTTDARIKLKKLYPDIKKYDKINETM